MDVLEQMLVMKLTLREAVAGLELAVVSMETLAARVQASAKIRVQCMECGKRWSTSNSCPRCPRCNSVDIEPTWN